MTITPELLRDVAAIWDQYGIEGVEQWYGRSRSQSYRLVRAAREEGLVR